MQVVFWNNIPTIKVHKQPLLVADTSSWILVCNNLSPYLEPIH